MVVSTDLCHLADVIFAIEGTAVNGVYLNDLKTSYIIPTLEYFNQGALEGREYVCYGNTSALYGIVVYHAADRLPSPCTDIYGPYSNPQRFLQMLDQLELVGGRGESHANVAEALATSLVCFDDMQLRREPGLNPQKHCILICNSPPYLMPVSENQTYSGNTAEQLAALFNERSVNLTILSSRKIPAMFKLFEKAGGDLTSMQSKNYAKDPRHLVLLKGFSLKERSASPVSCPTAVVGPVTGTPTASMPAVGGAPVRYPQVFVPTQAAPQGPRQRWSIMPQRPPQFSQPSSALLDQLSRPPTAITQQFSSSGGMGGMGQQQQQQVGGQQQMRLLSGAGQGMLGGGAAGGGASQGIMQPGLTSQIIQPQAPPGQQTSQPSVMPPQSSMMGQQAGIMGQTATSQPGMMGQPTSQPGMIGQPQPTQQPIMPQNTLSSAQRDRTTIWQGVIEWIEKAKTPNEPQKLTRHVPCQVSATNKDGEPEIKADAWPQKLIMQLMPKQLIGTIGGAYLKNSKSVVFHPSPCESLDALTKVMSTGFAGCVHFSCVPPCDIKVLILLYTSEKRAYLGFIPNDQTAFVDRLRKVIQQQKTSHALIRQQTGQTGGQGQPGMVQGQQAMSSLMQQPSQGQQQQSNPIMDITGGGMGPGGGGLMGGAGLAGGGAATMPSSLQPPGPSSAIQTSQQDSTAGQQQPPSQSGAAAAGGGFRDAARQENLVKIHRLRQTLEAAQQQEAQYRELESRDQVVCNPMLYEGGADQPGSNFYPEQRGQHGSPADWNVWPPSVTNKNAQILQFMNQLKMQQGMSDPSSQMTQQQPPIEMQMQQAGGQQRMMRPSALPNNNPGLRHLLQQPQYRLQQMQPQMRPTGLPNTQQPSQQQFEDVAYDFLG